MLRNISFLFLVGWPWKIMEMRYFCKYSFYVWDPIQKMSKDFKMRVRTIKILIFSYCLFNAVLLSGQEIMKVEGTNGLKNKADTVTGHVVIPVKGTPVPDITGPQDIHLDRDASIRFLQKIYSSSHIWKKSNDPLRESIRQLVSLASRPPMDSTIGFFSGYDFEKIRIPIDRYFVFDSIRIIVPVIMEDSSLTDTLPARERPGEMFVESGKRLEKVKLSSDASPVFKNDTLHLNDSVYILMQDFIPAVLPQKTNDTIILVITDTIPEASLNTPAFPFRYFRYPYMSDSLQAAVTSLVGYLEARDSTQLKICGENGRSTDVWLNSRSGNLIRFWLPGGDNDSVTVWIGSPERNTMSLKAEEGVLFRKQVWHDRYVDTHVNVSTFREENLRNVVLSSIRPQYWKFKSDISYLLSQGIISNWASGGENNISSVVDITGALNYNNKVTKVNSATTARFALGFQASGRPFDIRKNLDILEINSKINHKAFGKFDLSGLFQFKSQFLPGYIYPNDTTVVRVSKFFNPATFIFGYGLEYKPDKNTSISFSPVSYKGTFVPDTSINQTKFGIASDKRSKNELGAYLTINSKMSLFHKVDMTNRIQLFSNFLSKPQNVDVDWEVIATTSLNWFTDLRINLHLVYDDNTLLPVYERGEPVLGTDGKQKKAPMVQFKELLGLSFVFRF
jgi:hypothetical protein